MWDTRPVELRLDLPEPLAERIEEVRQRDPEFLARIIRYGLLRRTVYEELSRAWEAEPART